MIKADKKVIKMEGVSDYAEGYTPTLAIYNNRVVIEATNEGGYNGTSVDLEELLDWLDNNEIAIYEMRILAKMLQSKEKTK